MQLTSGFGIEELGAEIYINLYTNLNDTIQEVELSKASLDQRIATLREQVYVPVEIERIDPQNFQLNHTESVINPESAPLDSFPSVAVVAYRTTPSEFDAGLDQAEDYIDALFVEFYVKASPLEGPEICAKRVYRTADAVHNTVNRDRSVGGLVSDLGDSPTFIASEVFRKPKYENDGEDWWWQAGRIDYMMPKTSPIEF